MSSLPSNLSGRSAVKTSLTYHTRQQIRHKAYPKIKGAPGKHVGKPWKGISGEQNLHKIIKMERNPGKHFMDLKNDQMYQPEGLQGSKLVQSLSRMVLFGYHETDLLDRYAQRAMEVPGSLQPDYVGIMFNAFAKARHYNKELYSTFAGRIPKDLKSYAPRDLARITNSFARAKHQAPKLFQRISEEIPHKLGYADSQSIAMMVNAYTRLKKNSLKKIFGYLARCEF